MRPRDGDGGILALEFALVLPLVGVLMLALVLAGVHAVDQLQVAEAARVAARAAAVTSSGDAPIRAAREAAAPRDIEVLVVPAVRRHGDPIEVTVRHRRDVGFVHWLVEASAVAVAEPVTGP